MRTAATMEREPQIHLSMIVVSTETTETPALHCTFGVRRIPTEHRSVEFPWVEGTATGLWFRVYGFRIRGAIGYPLYVPRAYPA